MDVLLMHAVSSASPLSWSSQAQMSSEVPCMPRAGSPRSRAPGHIALGLAQRGAVWPWAALGLRPLFQPAVPFGPRHGFGP
jgi:hypothetical protein